MRRYCLNYDVKSSKKTNSEEIRIEITKTLIEAGAINLHTPTQTTILFEDTKETQQLSSWNALIHMTFHTRIFYYLCLVAINSKTKDHFDRNEGNPELDQNFQEIIGDF